MYDAETLVKQVKKNKGMQEMLKKFPAKQ